MPRIRTIKPEFWSSPSVAKTSAVGRLAFIAMWNWADDYGRGTANLKELEGFIFPNDDIAELSSGNTVNFRSVVAEVAERFGVLFYEADGRPYFAIPTWELHQRNERRAAQSKFPEPTGKPAFDWLVAEIPSQRTVDPNISGPGTGEQGNSGRGEEGDRGEGEQSSSSEIADAIRPEDERPEIDEILDYLDQQIRANGAKAPKRNKRNRDAVRLMIDRDERRPDQIRAAIDFATGDEFWRANILSASKLREKYDQLSLSAQRNNWKRPADRHERRRQFWEDEVAQMRALDESDRANVQGELEAS